jgi:hypothetical protein
MPIPLQNANLLTRKLEKLIQRDGQILLGSRINDDEECCLICGRSDYDDGNEIGFCDKCQMSVHLKCYGLGSDGFVNDFVCDQCKVFGVEAGMLVKCKLCAIHGGVLTQTCNEDFVANRSA